MPEVTIQSTFHNVGQGLFYTGCLKLHSSKFNFVYDCGTSSKKKPMNRIIDSYKSGLENNKLDMLVISHFHEDHISGLERILKGVNVGLVVIPYFTPFERLFIALGTTSSTKGYYRFLSDPVEYLLKKGVERVLIVGGSEGERYGSDKNGYRYNKVVGLYKSLFDCKDDFKLKNVIGKYESGWADFVKDDKLYIKEHSLVLKIDFFWIFKFFNYKLDFAQLLEFKRCVDDNSITPPNSNDIRTIISSKEGRDRLKKCYQKIKSNLNDSSLVLYHGPIDARETTFSPKCLSSFPSSVCCCSMCRHLNNRLGHLLTGDINLNDEKYPELVTHFRGFFKDISVALVPHHGSKHNWNADLKRRIYAKCKKPILWCASAGILNQWGHPDLDVVDDIRSFNCFHWVNEHSRLDINGTLHFTMP